MRLLSYTTLYPNPAHPHHGIFVENRLVHLVEHSATQTRIVAPVPWFPFRGSSFGQYGMYADIPRVEERRGLAIAHPRYPVIPKVGMTMAPYLLYRATLAHVRKNIQTHGDVDLIDAHYFYPDGVAAAMIAADLGKPVVITARGTDINLIPDYRLPRRMILWAAEQAAGVVTVCAALKERLVELGAEPDKIWVLRNGVDLALFHPKPRPPANSKAPFTLLSVGLLIPRKGHDLIIRALAQLPNTRLMIAGEGPERQNLKQLAESCGVLDRVQFLGRVAHDALPEIYSAADILILASDREGWPNVLLEAMACGTPVAATRIWGTPEVVTRPEAGRLIAERSPAGIAATVQQLLGNLPDRAATRRYAEQFSWQQTTDGQNALFQRIVSTPVRHSSA